jgi:predicted nucleotidyltransferase
MHRLIQVKNIIQKIKPDLLSRYHVSTIGIFGSVARGEDEEFIELADFLEDALNAKVDLVSKRGIKHEYLNFIKDEIIYV